MSGKKVEKMVERAVSYASDNNHEYILLEHILLSLLHENNVNELILSIGGSPSKIKTQTTEFLGDPAHCKPESLRSVPPKRTAALARVWQRALTQQLFSGSTDINNILILISLLSEEKSIAYYFLNSNGVTREKIIAQLRKMDERNEVAGEKQVESPLETYSRNLNREASDGSLDPVIGREKEVMDTIEVLARRKKNNIVYVGDPGCVGINTKVRIRKSAVLTGYKHAIIRR